MDHMTSIIRWFEFDSWANREALASLRDTESAPPKAAGILAHVLAAEWLWLDRLKPGSRSLEVWPGWTLDQCEQEESDVVDRWQDYLGALDPSELNRPVRYLNTKGEHWVNTVEDILTHVVLHSTHHRGQIAVLVRAAGGSPAYTDFIHAVRQGLVE